jgi:hypothetical protein
MRPPCGRPALRRLTPLCPVEWLGLARRRVAPRVLKERRSNPFSVSSQFRQLQPNAIETRSSHSWT